MLAKYEKYYNITQKSQYDCWHRDAFQNHYYVYSIPFKTPISDISLLAEIGGNNLVQIYTNIFGSTCEICERQVCYIRPQIRFAAYAWLCINNSELFPVVSVIINILHNLPF